MHAWAGGVVDRVLWDVVDLVVLDRGAPGVERGDAARAEVFPRDVADRAVADGVVGIVVVRVGLVVRRDVPDRDGGPGDVIEEAAGDGVGLRPIPEVGPNLDTATPKIPFFNHKSQKGSNSAM